MIRNFANRTARDVYNGVNTRQARALPRDLHPKARRLLDQLNAATRVEVLAAPPGNRLETLRGDRAGRWSIRINDQWRIVFRWEDTDALDVEIVDYHQ